MNYINEYLLEVDFPYHERIIEYKDDMLNQYYNEINEANQEGGFNIKYKNENLRKNVGNAFIRIVQEHFIVSPNINEIDMFLYVSTKDNFSSIWHNHALSSTISATFYLEINQVGGGLEFSDFKPNTILYPKKNKLYLFPSWMYHRPLPPKDNKTRICINMEYRCYQKPQIKNILIPISKQRTPIVW